MPLASAAPRMLRDGSTGIKQFDDRIAAAARSDADRRVAMKSVADRRRASVRAAGGNLGLSVAEREAQLVRSHRAIKSTVEDGAALLEHSRAYAALKSRLGASAAATELDHSPMLLFPCGHNLCRVCVQRLKKDNELFRSYMHQVSLETPGPSASSPWYTENRSDVATLVRDLRTPKSFSTTC